MNRRTLIPAITGGAVVAGAAVAVLVSGTGGPGRAALTGSVTGTTVTTASSTARPGCDLDAWGDRVQGVPDGFAPHDRGGVYLWHTTDGFHLRVTHAGNDRRTYTGAIRVNTTIAGFHPVRLEHADRVWLSADHRTLLFRFADYGHVDGVDFHTACATTLTGAGLKVGTAALPAGRVYLGDTRAHPAHVPFTLHRGA